MKLTEGGKANPFYFNTYSGHDVYTVITADMLECVRLFSPAQCEAALKIDDLQKTVRAAVERRLRKLRKFQRAAVSGLCEFGNG
jgi:hypothetical protein